MKSILSTLTLASLATLGRAAHCRHTATTAASVPVMAATTFLTVYGTPTTSTKATTPSTTSTTAAAAAATTATKEVASSSSSSGESESESASVSGESTFYGGNVAGGACSFSTYALPSSLFGTAYSGAVWDNAAQCGRCVEVTGPNGNSIKAMIVDECPECDQGHLDLFENAFSELGAISAGIISTSYKFVSCGITSPLVLHSKSGTSAYWFSMQVVNSNDGVAALEVSTDGGSTWQATTRKDYNFFENPSGFGTTTVDVRITSATGSKIVVNNVSVASDAQTTATSNFA